MPRCTARWPSRICWRKQAVEAELKMMQAQVEPHFLFNTLASVQYLTETDPREASRLLGHLLAYLRAALPQLRTATTTLGQEIALIEAYLNVFKTRMGPRLEFSIEVPEALRGHAFPPVLLISIVENAITHGLEPQAEGGSVRIEAMRDGDRLRVDRHRHRPRRRQRDGARGTWRRPRQRARAARRALRRARELHAGRHARRTARARRSRFRTRNSDETGARTCAYTPRDDRRRTARTGIADSPSCRPR